MLEVRSLSAAYGQHPALQEVTLTVSAGEIVVILGANGAGKSTLLRAISGVCEGQVSGDVTLGGQGLSGLTSDEIVEKGIALVPEGRGIFGDLSVKENLLLGAYSKRARSGEAQNLDRVMRLFPKLRERQNQIARTMSGGEQQMVAIGRAMMSAPEILMLDEPSLGLSPLLCKELFQNLAEVKKLGIGVLLVEQNAKQSLSIADRGYLLENTRIVHEDSASRLINDPAVQKAYLGAGGKSSSGTKREQEVIPQAPKTPAFVSPRPVPRRTAEQQIGLSIDEIVQSAAKTSSSAPSVTPAVPSVVSKDRVQAVIQDIEKAAKAARGRAQRASAGTNGAEMAPGPRRTAGVDDGPPPVIEVYRRPRVEVYRRRPGGSFERDQGEK